MASGKATVLLLVLIGCALPLHAARAGRALHQAKECKPQAIKLADLVAKKRVPCMTQNVLKDPKDAKSAFLLNPSTINDLVVVGDAACARLGFGQVDPKSIKWTDKAVECFDGKSVTSGIAFGMLSCCAPGTSLASWRETRAEMGGTMSSFARARDTAFESGVGSQGTLFP